MRVPVSYGEVVDKLTILALKVERLGSDHARHEHRLLMEAWDQETLPPTHSLPEHGELAKVNAALWEVEERLRDAEGRSDFGPAFVADARSVYRLNDRRAELKRRINQRLGSDVVEVKSYGR